VFDGVDACATPVLSPAEAHLHPQVAARGDFVEIDGHLQPSVAPRFGRTQGEAVAGHYLTGPAADAALGSWGIDDATLADLRAGGSLA
jgi:alpha-methylacyl-CoA racemase